MLSFHAPLFSTALAMAAFAFTGAVTPGPVNVLALRHGLRPQRGPALLFVLGASLSYVGVVLITGLGMATHLSSYPQVLSAARWPCAAYLLWLAWQLARSAEPWHDDAKAATPPSGKAAFREGALAQLLNPKAWLFAVSAVGVFVLHSPASGANSALQTLGLLCVISLFACSLGVGLWALLGRLLLGRLKSGGQRRLNLALALLLALSVLSVLL